MCASINDIFNNLHPVTQFPKLHKTSSYELGTKDALMQGAYYQEAVDKRILKL